MKSAMGAIVKFAITLALGATLVACGPSLHSDALLIAKKDIVHPVPEGLYLETSTNKPFQVAVWKTDGQTILRVRREDGLHDTPVYFMQLSGNSYIMGAENLATSIFGDEREITNSYDYVLVKVDGSKIRVFAPVCVLSHFEPPIAGLTQPQWESRINVGHCKASSITSLKQSFRQLAVRIPEYFTDDNADFTFEISK